MKSKVKKYFVVSLSLMLVLSNFSFAATLAFCKMNGDNSVCSCSHNNHTEKTGPAFKRMPNNCCETKIVELSNINILEVLNSYSVSINFQTDIFNTDAAGHFDNLSNAGRTYNELSYHPPNSEIPILYSTLLI